MTEHIPGPGSYSYKNMCIGHDTFNFTLKGKIKNLRGKSKPVSECLLEPDYLAERAAVPGPGSYKTLEIDKYGNYAISTIP